ncbi:MAG: polysaccharide biosynthesis tyrosine autokinase [Clostridia bacterium]|nr:polysaccharide biosynthesis tyrosine autokinase [Clostridia bacterium]
MNDEIELSLDDILKALKKKLALLIIVPILTAVAAGYFVVNHTVDRYTAEAKLYTLFEYMDSTGSVRYDMSSSSSFASDYKELIQAPNVMNETCRRLGWMEWPEEMEINVQAITGTRIINVSVTDIDPEVSMRATNVLATVFVEYVRNLMQNDSISIASEAVLPLEPSNGGRIKYVILAYGAMLALLMGLVILMEMVNTKVRSDGDVDVKLHVNVLSRVEGYKKEMDAFLKNRRTPGVNLLSSVSEYTRESIKKLALNLQFANMGKPLRTLTVTSTTPSEGKSSVSLMLAIEMANEGKQVLIVDMDYRSPMIGRYLGKRTKKDIMDYLGGNATLQEVVVKTNTPNLFFMDNNHHMAVNTRLDATDAFDEFIVDAKQYFDLIIFDTPPLGMFIDAASLAAKSDGVVVIVADGRIERKALENVFEQLKQVNAKLLGIAFNFVHHKEKSVYYNKYYRYGEQHKAERKKTNDIVKEDAQ